MSGADLLDDLLVAFLAVGRLGGVHLVDRHDQLLDAQRVGQQGVLTGLTILRDARLELTHPCCHNQHCTVSLFRGRNGRASRNMYYCKPLKGK